MNALDIAIEFEADENLAKDLAASLKGENYEAVEVASEVYKGNLGEDMLLYAKGVTEWHEKQPHVRRKKRLMTLGRHGIEVAKIAAGVVGGIALARKAKLL